VTTTCTVCELHAESTFKIEGMDCREEVTLLERRFKSLVGIEDFSADVMGQRLHVKYDAARLSTSTIADAVADTGMRAWLEHEEPIATTPSAERTRRILVWTSGAALAVGLAVEQSQAAAVAAPFLFVAAIAAGLLAVGRRAWNSVRAGVLDINVLMVLAVAGAIVLQQLSEAAAVIFLFAVAQALEARTLERARLAISALMDLTPADALVRDASGERRVGVDAILPGAVIVIKPGEKIPLDGAVVAGHSEVNQSPVTGESLPIEKAPGDDVFAGTINGRGALEVRVTKLRRDTTLARIIHLVERAQSQRAPSQTTIERFARIYTPLVIALAAAVAIVPPLMFGSSWQDWLYRALVLLVVSCPCALVISTPVSIVAALASAARKGVLIKGGMHLERTSAVKCVAFDKTGTLTRGAPEVVDVVALNGAPPSAVVDLAASVERRSTHPIAQAILRYAEETDTPAFAAERVTAHPGRGTEGMVGGRSVLLGNHRLFEERSLCSAEIHDHLAEMGAAGRTPVLVAHGGQAIGILAIADRAREVSRATVELLKEQGITRVVMLTGDSRATAAAIASELGVDEFRAELLPEDKVAAVEELRRKFGAVAMVGDGVNDAPALASADVGIAMGAAGSDAALETADIALMADELMKIPYAFRLSRATVRNIKANLAISIVLKAAFIVAAVTGVATLWMAVLADTGASVIVIANALRLLRAD
jgi:Cd2+/Zn2+-exporting ATPase